MAHSYIDALAGTGVDAVKWQMHIADAESSPLEPFRVPFSKEDRTRQDYWRRMEFTLDQWRGLKDHCDDAGLSFICSPFSIEAVEQLEKLECETYKIGSGEVSNTLLLDRVADTRADVILSSGLSDFNDLDRSIAFLRARDVSPSILQCSTFYPTSPEVWGLNVIAELRERYGLKTGFSDHSGDVHACLAATALGAEILEFHVVFDKRMFGPDAKASIEINEIERLAKGIRNISEALHHPIDKSLIENQDRNKQIFGKSLTVRRNMKAGETLTKQDLETAKPSGSGIDVVEFDRVVGKRLLNDKSQRDFLNHKDIDSM